MTTLGLTAFCQPQSKRQLDTLALHDFESASGACSNGTLDVTDVIIGTFRPGYEYRRYPFRFRRAV